MADIGKAKLVDQGVAEIRGPVATPAIKHHLPFAKGEAEGLPKWLRGVEQLAIGRVMFAAVWLFLAGKYL